MSEKSFLDHAADFTYQKLESSGGDPAKLDTPLRTIAVLYWIQAIIDNGGFRYLFETDFPFLSSYSTFSDAYRQVGSKLNAERLDKAVAMFPFDKAHLDQQKRLDFMESLEEEDEFFQLGDQVCGDKTVWLALEDYAKKHAALFRVM